MVSEEPKPKSTTTPITCIRIKLTSGGALWPALQSDDLQQRLKITARKAGLLSEKHLFAAF
jgi:hypothetical protein